MRLPGEVSTGHTALSLPVGKPRNWVKDGVPLLESALALGLSLGWAWVPPLGGRVSLSRGVAEGVAGSWHVPPTDYMSQANPGAALALLSIGHCRNSRATGLGTVLQASCSEAHSRGALLVRCSLPRPTPRQFSRNGGAGEVEACGDLKRALPS